MMKREKKKGKKGIQGVNEALESYGRKVHAEPSKQNTKRNYSVKFSFFFVPTGRHECSIVNRQ